jgi:hypothetical protein
MAKLEDMGMTTSQVYQWMAEQLGLSAEDCHVSMFNRKKARHAENLLGQKLRAMKKERKEKPCLES